ncbi:hypothetical protein BDK51DRAFT_32013 [Blyttiomyces helicus]|uniref:Uncharacterized protein n=1 Tax=Blyttiomyces helicus TaxID=388810 RepID=A0A4V1IQB5_9FUNG|nr:hypothetical protein BDK51DRAFT_32013 [Blyttiomyces helicus]|eukprot:RKO85977.1 hypothetical protein BDK51DRAFT_32013 [Blyttiomyces helicus]
MSQTRKYRLWFWDTKTKRFDILSPSPSDTDPFLSSSDLLPSTSLSPRVRASTPGKTARGRAGGGSHLSRYGSRVNRECAGPGRGGGGRKAGGEVTKEGQLQWTPQMLEALLDTRTQQPQIFNAPIGSEDVDLIFHFWMENLQPMDEETKASDSNNNTAIVPQHVLDKWKKLCQKMKRRWGASSIKETDFWSKYRATISADGQDALRSETDHDDIDSEGQDTDEAYKPSASSDTPVPPSHILTNRRSFRRVSSLGLSSLPPTPTVHRKSAENVESTPKDQESRLLREIGSPAPLILSRTLLTLSLLTERLEDLEARMKTQIDAQKRQLNDQKTEIDAQKAQIDGQKRQIDAQKTLTNFLQESLELRSQDRLALNSEAGRAVFPWDQCRFSKTGPISPSHPRPPDPPSDTVSAFAIHSDMRMRNAGMTWKLAAMAAQAKDLTENLGEAYWSDGGRGVGGIEIGKILTLPHYLAAIQLQKAERSFQNPAIERARNVQEQPQQQQYSQSPPEVAFFMAAKAPPASSCTPPGHQQAPQCASAPQRPQVAVAAAAAPPHPVTQELMGYLEEGGWLSRRGSFNVYEVEVGLHSALWMGVGMVDNNVPSPLLPVYANPGVGRSRSTQEQQKLTKHANYASKDEDINSINRSIKLAPPARISNQVS